MRFFGVRGPMSRRWAAVPSAVVLLILAGCNGSGSAAPASSPSSVPKEDTTASATTVSKPISSTSAPATSKPVKADPTKAFCADAKTMADTNAQTQKDVAAGVVIVAPAYVKKATGDTVAQLNTMNTDAPPAIAPVVKEFYFAIVAYAAEIAKNGFVLQPKDPGEQQVVIAASKVYGPIATADLPKLDTYVTQTCGFSLNLTSSK